MIRVLPVFILNVLCVTAFAQNIQLKDLVRDANFASQTSDHYKAYRLYKFVERKSPDVLVELGVSRYLHTLSVVSDVSEIRKFCREIESKVSKKYRDRLYYHCSKSLLSSSKTFGIKKMLSKISKNSRFYPFGQILLSTVYLGENDGLRCEKAIRSTRKELFVNQKIEDLYELSLARCSVASEKYDQALRHYQEVSQDSPHYFMALEEIGWIYFKKRDLERASEVYNVITAAYRAFESGQTQRVSDRMYYNIRYLRSYLDILRKDKFKESTRFLLLKKHVSEYRKKQDVFKPKMKKQVLRKVLKENEKWVDLASSDPLVLKYLNLVQIWTDNKMVVRLKKEIELIMAVTRENRRLKDFKIHLGVYPSQLKKLKTRLSKEIFKSHKKSIIAIDRKVKAIELKADMGELEVEWVNRNEGIRDANELLKSYLKSIKSVEDYIGSYSK